MKKVKFQLSYFLPVAALLLFLAACQNEELTQELTSEKTSTTQSEMEELPVYYADLLESPAIVEATVEEDMGIVSDGLPMQVNEVNTLEFRNAQSQFWNLKACLSGLNLTQDQQDSIRVYAQKLHRCQAYHIHEVRVINRTIISQANQQRRVWVQEFKNGEITRQQLIRNLVKLNNRTKVALASNLEKLRHLKHVRQCFFGFARALNSTLDVTQWNDFVSCYRNR